MNQKLATFAVVLAPVLVGAIAFVAVWSPQSKDLVNQRQQLASAQGKEAQQQTQINALRVQQAAIPAINAKLAVLNRALPVLPALAQVIDDINAAAVASGVDLTSLNPAKTLGTAVIAPGPAKAVDTSISLSLTCTYPQLINFVNRLNALPRLAVIDGLGLASGTGSSFTVTVPLRVFNAAAG